MRCRHCAHQLPRLRHPRFRSSQGYRGSPQTSRTACGRSNLCCAPRTSFTRTNKGTLNRPRESLFFDSHVTASQGRASVESSSTPAISLRRASLASSSSLPATRSRRNTLDSTDSDFLEPLYHGDREEALRRNSSFQSRRRSSTTSAADHFIDDEPVIHANGWTVTTSSRRRNTVKPTVSATPSDFEGFAHGDRQEGLRRNSSAQSRRRSSTTSAADHAVNAEPVVHANKWAVPESPAEVADSDTSYADTRNDAASTTPLLVRRKHADELLIEDASGKSFDERRVEALREAPIVKNIVTRQEYKRELVRIQRLSLVATNQLDDEIHGLR
eukprot:Opistho-1_new@90089